jgi:hypothetical protein
MAGGVIENVFLMVVVLNQLASFAVVNLYSKQRSYYQLSPPGIDSFHGAHRDKPQFCVSRLKANNSLISPMKSNCQ